MDKSKTDSELLMEGYKKMILRIRKERKDRLIAWQNKIFESEIKKKEEKKYEMD